MTKPLPKELTSYDVLKFLAILFMIADHIGGFFFPEEEWWRAVGRLSAPIWLFLIGYARSRDLSPRLWAGAGILIFSSFFIGPAILPLNILVTIIIIRLVLDRTASYMLSDKSRMIAVGAVLFFAMPISWFFLDYGTAGLMVALFGYLIRRQEEDDRITKDTLQEWGMFSLASFLLITYFGFLNFPLAQKWFVGLTLPLVFIALSRFKPAIYPGLTERLPSVLVRFIQFGGRRSLEVYVFHILLFKLIGCFLGLNRLGLFEWQWY